VPTGFQSCCFFGNCSGGYGGCQNQSMFYSAGAGGKDAKCSKQPTASEATCGYGGLPSGKKIGFGPAFYIPHYIQMIILPRQARDKHRWKALKTAPVLSYSVLQRRLWAACGSKIRPAVVQLGAADERRWQRRCENTPFLRHCIAY
jgi:hypothetical protein